MYPHILYVHVYCCHVVKRTVAAQQKTIKYKMPISLDSRRFYERYRAHSLVGDENNLLNLTSEELQALSQDMQLNSHEPSESEQAYGDESKICNSFDLEARVISAAF